MNMLRTFAGIALLLSAKAALAVPLIATLVSVEPSQYGLSLTLEGEFRIPTIPVDAQYSSVSYSLSGVFGGALWRTGRDGEEVTGTIGGSIALGFRPNGMGGILNGSGNLPWSSAIGFTSVTFVDGFEPGPQWTPTLDFLREGNPLDAGGYVPVYFRLYHGASGSLAFVPPPYYPSVAIFAGNFDLDYSLQPLGATEGIGVTSTSAAASTYYFEKIVDGGQPMPEELRAQIPAAFLPSAVPEPSTLLLFAAALGVLAVVARRQTDVSEDSAG